MEPQTKFVNHDQLKGGFPGGLVVKNPPANEGDKGSILGSGRSPGEENSNPLQYSFLGNPMDRGDCRATVHGVAKVNKATKQQQTRGGLTLIHRLKLFFFFCK